MTNPNVVISDSKSSINMAITVTVSKSSIFQATAQKPPAGPSTGGYISISRSTKFLQPDGSARINTWVDSMRASSPSRIKPNSSLSDDQTSWMVCHPSNNLIFNIIIISLFYVLIITLTFSNGTAPPSFGLGHV